MKPAAFLLWATAGGAIGGSPGPVPTCFVPTVPASACDLAATTQLPTWQSCVVVGSSGNVLGRGLGPFIDSHDGVFRINLAPTVGYERDVGSKEVVRVLNNGASSPLGNWNRPTGVHHAFIHEVLEVIKMTTSMDHVPCTDHTVTRAQPPIDDRRLMRVDSCHFNHPPLP